MTISDTTRQLKRQLTINRITIQGHPYVTRDYIVEGLRRVVRLSTIATLLHTLLLLFC